MKINILFLILMFNVYNLNAQSILSVGEFGQIMLNTYIPSEIIIENDAKKYLINKLERIASKNGIVNISTSSRFFLTVALNVVSNDIIAGPPQLITQNIDITFFIGDAIEQKLFSELTISLKGVGVNKNKSLIDAIAKINTEIPELSSFMEVGRNRIIIFYNSQCASTIQECNLLSNQHKFNEAIYKLALIPTICQDCYLKCLKLSDEIYAKKINFECNIQIQQAKIAWAQDMSLNGLEVVSKFLTSINPMSSCQDEIKQLIDKITMKLKSDEKKRWDFKMKQYIDSISMQRELVRIASQDKIQAGELRKIQIRTYKEIAFEYARNQPKIIIVNRFFFR